MRTAGALKCHSGEGTLPRLEAIRKDQAVRGRQPGLFRLENPLTGRMGPAFFTALPRQPGVYFFYDGQDRLLYIGQSSDLRARVGSNRHVTPDRHPRRILRLVASIRRIGWELCGSAAGAIERERVLLLEHRPPFNRAGVWAGAPWWLEAGSAPGTLLLELKRGEGEGIGPLPASFRHLLGPLARCFCRALNPDLPLHRYPHGLCRVSVPLSLRIPAPHPEGAVSLVAEGVSGRFAGLFALLDAVPPPASPQLAEYWAGERKTLEDYGRREAGRAAPAADPP